MSLFAGGLHLVLAVALSLSPDVPAQRSALPVQITVETPRGTSMLPVTLGGLAGPVIPGDALIAALNGSVRLAEPWIEITLARQSFRFLAGAPFYSFNDRLEPLAGWAYRSRDSLFLPLQFVTEILPRVCLLYTSDAADE